MLKLNIEYEYVFSIHVNLNITYPLLNHLCWKEKGGGQFFFFFLNV